MALSEQQAQEAIAEIWRDPKYIDTRKNIERAIAAKDDSPLMQLLDKIFDFSLGAPKGLAQIIKLLVVWAKSLPDKQ